MFSHMERGRKKGAREDGGGGREGEGKRGRVERSGEEEVIERSRLLLKRSASNHPSKEEPVTS